MWGGAVYGDFPFGELSVCFCPLAVAEDWREVDEAGCRAADYILTCIHSYETA